MEINPEMSLRSEHTREEKNQEMKSQFLVINRIGIKINKYVV